MTSPRSSPLTIQDVAREAGVSVATVSRAFNLPDKVIPATRDLVFGVAERLAYGRLDTAPYLHQAVETVLRLPQRPDAIVITGDLTDFGRSAEYAHLRELLAPLGAVPLYLLPGNHDDRTQLRASFPEHAYLGEEGFVQYRVPVGGLQLIALDTVVPGASEGGLCQARLAWLEQQLEAYHGQPVVIAMHTRPFARSSATWTPSACSKAPRPWRPSWYGTPMWNGSFAATCTAPSR
ncbi:hypothetical protein AVHM3334_13640 [Acidovorax sp. SUPP3334]|nr:hypothetical protein AVHM3334_13640 [Acidovorax sp. SUPP3334]